MLAKRALQRLVDENQTAASSFLNDLIEIRAAIEIYRALAVNNHKKKTLKQVDKEATQLYTKLLSSNRYA